MELVFALIISLSLFLVGGDTVPNYEPMVKMSTKSAAYNVKKSGGSLDGLVMPIEDEIINVSDIGSYFESYGGDISRLGKEIDKQNERNRKLGVKRSLMPPIHSGSVISISKVIAWAKEV